VTDFGHRDLERLLSDYAYRVMPGRRVGGAGYGCAMTTYSGPARLILGEGACVSGMASLRTDQRGGLEGWSGTFRPDRAGPDLENASDGLQLELPYERIGDVKVTGVRKFLASQVLMSLAGSGPAPF